MKKWVFDMVFQESEMLEQNILENLENERSIIAQLIEKGLILKIYVKADQKSELPKGAYIVVQGENPETVRRELSTLPFWMYYDFEKSKVDEILSIY